MPRIAVTFAWLGVIAGAVALNMVRYPVVSEMARGAYAPEPAAQPTAPAQAAEKSAPELPAVPKMERNDRSGHQGDSPIFGAARGDVERKLEPSPDKPLPVAPVESQQATVRGQAIGDKEQPNRSPQQAVSAPAMEPVPQPEPASAFVDAADLGNGVRRLPAVDQAGAASATVAPPPGMGQQDW